jgi:hypothetical protein
MQQQGLAPGTSRVPAVFSSQSMEEMGCSLQEEENREWYRESGQRELLDGGKESSLRQTASLPPYLVKRVLYAFVTEINGRELFAFARVWEGSGCGSGRVGVGVGVGVGVASGCSHSAPVS